MGSRSDKSVAALGFLTVCDLEGRSLVGGYLLLNAAGRPLEFHCTAPVRPSRAQEILYGPTLEPFLYGEQIGRALVEKSTAAPLAVFTDLEAVLASQAFVAAPMAIVVATHPDEEKISAKRISAPQHHIFEHRGNALAVPAANAADAATIVETLSAHAVTFDLAEPFDRIREAVREAHRDAASRTAKPAAAGASAASAEAA